MPASDRSTCAPRGGVALAPRLRAGPCSGAAAGNSWDRSPCLRAGAAAPRWPAGGDARGRRDKRARALDPPVNTCALDPPVNTPRIKPLFFAAMFSRLPANPTWDQNTFLPGLAGQCAVKFTLFHTVLQ